MSVYTSVYALDSKLEAPEIGDHGCIGFPPIDKDGEPHEFLRIYRGLREAGLATLELDRFNAFLEAHRDEPLYFYVEGDVGEDAERLDRMLEDFDQRGQQVPVFDMPGEDDYTRARFRISCGDNHYTASSVDYFRNVDTLTRDKAELAGLINKVFEADDWETDFYRVGGIIDPYDGDLGRIRRFILDSPGPFSIEYLTGDNADATPAAAKMPAPASESGTDSAAPIVAETPAPKSKWASWRKTIIVVFLIWMVIRVIYHLMK